MRELASNTIADTVKAGLDGLNPRLLEVEITESLVMKNLDTGVLVLRQLRALGVRVAMDDFGIGYSSLSRISHLPLTRLKIDKLFVRSIDNADKDNNADNDGEELARAVIALGRALRLEVIAEGVEVPQQLEFLRAENCGEFQGYLGGQPMPAQHVLKLLTTHGKPDADVLPPLSKQPAPDDVGADAHRLH